MPQEGKGHALLASFKTETSTEFCDRRCWRGCVRKTELIKDARKFDPPPPHRLHQIETSEENRKQVKREPDALFSESLL